jgi:hypothetical protein
VVACKNGVDFWWVDFVVTYVGCTWSKRRYMLRGGIGYVFDSVQGSEFLIHLSCRRYLRYVQGNVVELCRQSASVASDMTPGSQEESKSRAEIELAACTLATRALLIGNKDAEAFLMAQQCLDVARKSFSHVGSEDKRWQAMVLSTSVAGLVQHASCELDSAADSFDNVLSLIEGDNGARTALDYLIPDALKQASSFAACRGRKELAVSLGMRSIAAAESRLEMATNGLDPMLSPIAAEEIVADAKFLMAQSCMHRSAWEDAEEKLNAALGVVESIVSNTTGEGQHPYIGMTLLPLAEVYCRTGRVTLAEGLYREIVKILDLSPKDNKRGSSGVHPTVNSLVAWRYAQLLTVLPKRETEAKAWKDLSFDIYDDAPLKRLTEPDIMFGSLDRLSGKGIHGQGTVLDLMTRRVLPCTKDSSI